jgi:hypothetical protein
MNSAKAKVIKAAEFIFVVRINILMGLNIRGVEGGKINSIFIVIRSVINERGNRVYKGPPPIMRFGVRATKYANITKRPPT